MSKKLITFFCFWISIQTAFAQMPNIDSTLQKIKIENDDNKKVDLIVSFYTAEFNNDPNMVIEIGIMLLKQAQADKSILEEASAYSMLGHGYRLMGSNIKALEYHHKAIALAKKINK